MLPCVMVHAAGARGAKTTASGGVPVDTVRVLTLKGEHVERSNVVSTDDRGPSRSVSHSTRVTEHVCMVHCSTPRSLIECVRPRIFCAVQECILARGAHGMCPCAIVHEAVARVIEQR